MKRSLIVVMLVMVFGTGSALAQPNYQFAEAGTKNFITEDTIVVGDQISLDVYLANAGAPQVAGGAWIDFTGSTAEISYVSGGRCLNPDTEGCAGPWVLPGGVFANEPDGAGTVMYVNNNLGGADPDGDGDLIIGTLTLECSAVGDAIVNLTTIPSFHTWSPMDDTDIVPGSLLIHQIPPCTIDGDCDDGVVCTVDTCNVGTGSCVFTPDNTSCDDGLFCTGVETCDPVNDCQPGPGDPCVPDICDEVNDVCVECVVAITPAAVSMAPGAMQTFTATTTCNGETIPGTYTWDIEGGTANTTTGQSIDYTYGYMSGPYTITVTDTANGNITGTASILVNGGGCVISVSDVFSKSHWVPLPAVIKILTYGIEITQRRQVAFECASPLSVIKLIKLVNSRAGIINQFAIIMPAFLTGNFQDETETCTVRVEDCEQTDDFELNMLNLGPIPLSE